MSRRFCLPVYWAFLVVVWVVSQPACADDNDRKNWICGGSKPWIGLFEQTEPAVYPWTGVDRSGFLRKAVAVPSCYPFITMSNQFTYAWLGNSASFVDLDGDNLPDIVSPDGNGMFWFWKNTGTPGKPVFGAGEVIPMLVDDLRSEFAPILNSEEPEKEPGGSGRQNLTSAQQAEKERVDRRRDREFDRLKRRNERQPKNKRLNDRELRKQVEEMFPYEWEQTPEGAPVDSDATPVARFQPKQTVPPGGLVCTLNSFRRLRLVACPVDWNGDGAPDFLAGDSGGTVYLAPNTGQPGRPQFGYSSRATHALPLKVVRTPGEAGKPASFEAVTFLNYAMPFACDWNGDGAPDLLLGEGTYSVNAVRLFTGITAASLQNPPRETALYVGENRTFLSPFAYDWDADGDLDLFVCDSEGRLTVHRREGDGLAEPLDLLVEGGQAVLAYCTPQPCDWNADGTMDLIWGEPFGRIMVALGKEPGGTSFAAPEAIRSTVQPAIVEMPASSRQGRTVSLAAVPARIKDAHGGTRKGGTADGRRYYMPDGTREENQVGWPIADNNPFYGQMPPWLAENQQLLQDQLQGDTSGTTHGKSASWGIAPIPGDVWEVVEEPGAPGRGRTLLLRWHDPSKNAVFKTETIAPIPWIHGVAMAFDSGRSSPFATSYTDKSITIKFHMKLEGNFSRLDVHFKTNWGPPVKNKPPAPGGDIHFKMEPVSTGQWVEVTHTEDPHENYQRGIDGDLYIELLGKGEVRIRDIRIFEGE